MVASYALRERKEIDYWNKLPLPRARRNKHARICPIEVVEEKDEQYVSYTSSDMIQNTGDEWRPRDRRHHSAPAENEGCLSSF